MNFLIEQYKETCDKNTSLEKENRKNFKLVKQYGYIVDIFNSNNCINKLEFEVVLGFMKKENYNVEDVIAINERIIERNEAIKGNTNYNSEVLKMLNEEIKPYDMNGILVNKTKSRKEELDNTIASIVKSINKDSKYESIKAIMPDENSTLYSEDEINYIFKSVMNYYINSMNGDREFMKDYELYSNYDMKITILNEYYDKKNIYSKLRDLHINSIKEEDSIEEETAKRNLIFIKSGEQSSFFERDIEKLPKTMLDTVKHLIEGFTYDSLAPAEIKAFGSSNKNIKNFLELKSGQIRIMCINISNNNYAVIGAGIKKTDNDRALYERFEKRQSFLDNAYDIEESKFIHQKVLEYIELNSRKGNR